MLRMSDQELQRMMYDNGYKELLDVISPCAFLSLLNIVNTCPPLTRSLRPSRKPRSFDNRDMKVRTEEHLGLD